MRVCIELSPGPLIEFSAFCLAIARAICPADERPLEGIECVVGTRAKHGSAPLSQDGQRWFPGAGSESMPIPEQGRTLEQLSIHNQQSEVTDSVANFPVDPWQSEVEEVWLPFALTDSERRWLEGRLPYLPPLRYPMSDEEVAVFLDAYRRVEQRPVWEPVLLTEADIGRRKAEQALVLTRQRKALEDELAAGRVTAVDSRYVPVPVLAMGSFIPREQAIAYLERCGLAHDGNCARPEMWATQRRTVPGGEPPAAAMSEVEQARGDTEPVLTTQKMVKKPVGSKTGGRLRLESDDGAEFGAKASPTAERRPIGKVARLRRVMELTGLGRSSIYNRMDSRSAHYDPTFPCSFPLGATGGAVGWDEEAIKTWVAAQVASARQ